MYEAVPSTEPGLVSWPTAAERAGPLGPVLDRLLDKDPQARPDPGEIRSLLRAVAADPDAAAAAVPPPRTVEPETGGHTVALVPAYDVTTGNAAPSAPGGSPSRAKLAVAWIALVVVVFVLSAAIATLVAR